MIWPVLRETVGGTTDKKCEESVNARQKSNGRKNGHPSGHPPASRMIAIIATGWRKFNRWCKKGSPEIALGFAP